MAEKEFRVNEHIVLKLEGKKTQIYVNGNIFNQCKYLLLINPQYNSKQWEINSIDEAAEVLRNDLEKELALETLGITPEEEFFGHCSNIQAWAENDYDTRLLHYSLSFPLLEELKKLGDEKAKREFLKEIIDRFATGIESVQKYILDMGYLYEFYTNEEILEVALNEDSLKILKQIAKEVNKPLDQINISYGSGKITGITLSHLDTVPKSLFLTKDSLKRLEIRGGELKSIPDWLFEFKQLKELSIIYNNINELPESIKNWEKLNKLLLYGNSLKNIPNSIGMLRELKKLNLNGNLLTCLPDSIGGLRSLEILDLGQNRLYALPESTGDFSELKYLTLDDNYFKSVPAPVQRLKNLESIGLIHNPLVEIQNWVYELPKLRRIRISKDQEKLAKEKNEKKVDIY